MPLRPYKVLFDELYSRYNHKRFIHPDPLEFVFRYRSAADREVAGLVASCLAYGRVQQILASVAKALAPMGASPAEYLRQADRRRLIRDYADFRHRFSGGRELANLLWGAAAAIRKHGSLERAFAAGDSEDFSTVLPALRNFVKLLRLNGGRSGHLLPEVHRGSACKRLNLFLRWMARRDAVDPGVWKSLSPSRLLVPLDTHMYRIATALGATSRRSADLKTAEEVTAAFRKISPADPVRYDFALTRLGIRGNGQMEAFLAKCRMM